MVAVTPSTKLSPCLGHSILFCITQWDPVTSSTILFSSSYPSKMSCILVSMFRSTYGFAPGGTFQRIPCFGRIGRSLNQSLLFKACLRIHPTECSSSGYTNISCPQAINLIVTFNLKSSKSDASIDRAPLSGVAGDIHSAASPCILLLALEPRKLAINDAAARNRPMLLLLLLLQLHARATHTW